MTQISKSVLELFEVYLSYPPDERKELLEVFDGYVKEKQSNNEWFFAKIRVYLTELLNK